VETRARAERVERSQALSLNTRFSRAVLAMTEDGDQSMGQPDHTRTRRGGNTRAEIELDFGAGNGTRTRDFGKQTLGNIRQPSIAVHRHPLHCGLTSNCLDLYGVVHALPWKKTVVKATFYDKKVEAQRFLPRFPRDSDARAELERHIHALAQQRDGQTYGQPPSASSGRIRSTASSGSRSKTARSARRNSSARCRIERALSCPPSMRKCLWCPFRMPGTRHQFCKSVSGP